MSKLQVLQHSLGVDEFGRGKHYRSHFVCGPGHSDHDTCLALVDLGLMVRRAAVAMYGGDDCFHVTPDGRSWMIANSPPPPKLTRSQQRYRDWLDADCGVPFGEWMRRSSQPADWAVRTYGVTESEIPF